MTDEPEPLKPVSEMTIDELQHQRCSCELEMIARKNEQYAKETTAQFIARHGHMIRMQEGAGYFVFADGATLHEHDLGDSRRYEPSPIDHQRLLVIRQFWEVRFERASQAHNEFLVRCSEAAAASKKYANWSLDASVVETARKLREEVVLCGTELKKARENFNNQPHIRIAIERQKEHQQKAIETAQIFSDAIRA